MNPHIFSEPDQLRLFSRAEYYKMAEVGIFAPDEKLELIEGVIRKKVSPVGVKHASRVRKLDYIFSQLLSENDAIIYSQNPIILDDGTEPEPDLTLLKPQEDEYFYAHPRTEDVLLVIEVSDSTLQIDRLVKLERYAEANIPEYWIVNIPEEKIEVYRNPENKSYVETSEYHRGKIISPLKFPDAPIEVKDIFPEKR